MIVRYYRICIVLLFEQGDDAMADKKNPLTIEDGVVINCNYKAREAIIPAGVRAIGKEAFCNCDLMSVVIPKGVIEIRNDAFASCIRLPILDIPNSVTKIGSGAFSHCYSLNDVEIPKCVTKIEEKTFFGCAIKKIAIPKGVTYIGSEAFASCKSLTDIAIPASVAEIDTHAFYGCTSLMEIRFDGTKAQWAAIKKGDDWYSGILAELVHCTNGYADL